MAPPSKSETLRAISYRALSYGFPLLTIPAFAAALPPEQYGKLGLALTFCSVLQAVAEGGHNIAGARDLIHSDPRASSTLSGRIYDQKLALLCVSIISGLAFHLVTGAAAADIALFIACFAFIVVPDALTPTWIFHATGNLAGFTRLQFISRAIALPAMLGCIWLWPTVYAGAFLTGLPFLICAVLAIKTTSVHRLLPGFRRPLIANIARLKLDHILVFMGTMSSTLTPALAMQSLGFIYGRDDLGSVYLAIVLWLACRQLCALANTATFHQFASSRDPLSIDMAALLSSARWGAAIALAGAATVAAIATLIGSWEHLKYRETLRALPIMLLGLVLYSFGHALAVNRLAATGRSGAFALVHFGSAVVLVLVCFSASPYLSRPGVLGLAMVCADAALFILAYFAHRHYSAAR